MGTNLDGSDAETLVTANPGIADWPTFIDLDLVGKKVYWANGEDGDIYWSNMDGTGAEKLLLAGVVGPFGLAVHNPLPTSLPGEFRRGDCNGDGSFDISDAIVTLFFVVLGNGELGCDDACDSNDDGTIEILDAINTLLVMFLGQGEIPLPGALECGPDPTQDAMGCETSQVCP